MRTRRAVRADLCVGSLLVVVVMWLLSDMPAGAQSREDPLFSGLPVKLEIQGLPSAVFIKDISGIGSESDVVEQKAVSPTGQTIVQHMPGRLKWKEIVVRRGMMPGDKTFSAWRAQVETGNIQGAIRTFSITFLNSSLQPVARWEGVGGWPSKLIIVAPSGTASSSTTPVPLLEELTIVHSGLVRTQ